MCVYIYILYCDIIRIINIMQVLYRNTKHALALLYTYYMTIVFRGHYTVRDIFGYLDNKNYLLLTKYVGNDFRYDMQFFSAFSLFLGWVRMGSIVRTSAVSRHTSIIFYLTIGFRCFSLFVCLICGILI